MLLTFGITKIVIKCQSLIMDQKIIGANTKNFGIDLKFGIDGSASFKKIAKKTNRQTTKFTNSMKNCESIIHKKTLKKSKYFLCATC